MTTQRTVELDLWDREGRSDIPTITVTQQGLKFEGEGPQFDRLPLILGGWMPANEPT